MQDTRTKRDVVWDILKLADYADAHVSLIKKLLETSIGKSLKKMVGNYTEKELRVLKTGVADAVDSLYALTQAMTGTE